MTYKIKAHTNFKKALKKILDKALKAEISDILENIQDNPTSFEELKHNWAGYQSAHFHRAPEYRILFKVYQCKAQQEATGEAYCQIDQHEDEEGEETENPPILRDCMGLIYFIMLGTREEFNHLYKTDKKVIQQYEL
jgi:mRNA-degrading endonuclease RelE of RelBE toxin-antitoxin system